VPEPRAKAKPRQKAADAARPQSPESGQPSEAGSGEGSPAAASSGPFIGDPGPAHDSSGESTAAAPAGAELHVLPVPPPLWKPERVATLLKAQGALTHATIGIAERDWLWLEHELQATAEPLAAVLNKHPVTQAAAGASDELAAAIGLFGYAGRSIRERAAELERRKHAAAQQGPQPVTGRAADPPLNGNGPEPTPPDHPDDVEWRTE